MITVATGVAIGAATVATTSTAGTIVIAKKQKDLEKELQKQKIEMSALELSLGMSLASTAIGMRVISIIDRNRYSRLMAEINDLNNHLSHIEARLR